MLYPTELLCKEELHCIHAFMRVLLPPLEGDSLHRCCTERIPQFQSCSANSGGMLSTFKAAGAANRISAELCVSP